jgi:hypothetical protein
MQLSKSSSTLKVGEFDDYPLGIVRNAIAWTDRPE